jgi:hypothetical protein
VVIGAYCIGKTRNGDSNKILLMMTRIRRRLGKDLRQWKSE